MSENSAKSSDSDPIGSPDKDPQSRKRPTVEDPLMEDLVKCKAIKASPEEVERSPQQETRNKDIEFIVDAFDFNEFTKDYIPYTKVETLRDIDESFTTVFYKELLNNAPQTTVKFENPDSSERMQTEVENDMLSSKSTDLISVKFENPDSSESMQTEVENDMLSSKSTDFIVPDNLEEIKDRMKNQSLKTDQIIVPDNLEEIKDRIQNQGLKTDQIIVPDNLEEVEGRIKNDLQLVQSLKTYQTVVSENMDEEEDTSFADDSMELIKSLCSCCKSSLRSPTLCSSRFNDSDDSFENDQPAERSLTYRQPIFADPENFTRPDDAESNSYQETSRASSSMLFNPAPVIDNLMALWIAVQEVKTSETCSLKNNEANNEGAETNKDKSNDVRQDGNEEQRIQGVPDNSSYESEMEGSETDLASSCSSRTTVEEIYYMNENDYENTEADESTIGIDFHSPFLSDTQLDRVEREAQINIQSTVPEDSTGNTKQAAAGPIESSFDDDDSFPPWSELELAEQQAYLKYQNILSEDSARKKAMQAPITSKPADAVRVNPDSFCQADPDSRLPMKRPKDFVLPRWVTHPAKEPDYDNIRRTVQQRRECVRDMLQEIEKKTSRLVKVWKVLRPNDEYSMESANSSQHTVQGVARPSANTQNVSSNSRGNSNAPANTTTLQTIQSRGHKENPGRTLGPNLQNRAAGNQNRQDFSGNVSQRIPNRQPKEDSTFYVPQNQRSKMYSHNPLRVNDPNASVLPQAIQKTRGQNINTVQNINQQPRSNFASNQGNFRWSQMQQSHTKNHSNAGNNVVSSGTRPGTSGTAANSSFYKPNKPSSGPKER